LLTEDEIWYGISSDTYCSSLPENFRISNKYREKVRITETLPVSAWQTEEGLDKETEASPIEEPARAKYFALGR
jgi:hypothetical protein